MISKEYLDKLEKLYDKELLVWESLRDEERALKEKLDKDLKKAASQTQKAYLAENYEKAHGNVTDKMLEHRNKVYNEFSSMVREYADHLDEVYAPRVEDYDEKAVALLRSVSIHDREFSRLVERYADNHTMIRVLAHYAEGRSLSDKALLTITENRSMGAIDRDDFKRLCDYCKWSACGEGIRQPEDVRGELARARKADES